MAPWSAAPRTSSARSAQARASPEIPRRSWTSVAEKPVPLYVPYVGSGEAAAVARVLASRWLTQGPEVAAFEKEFAAYVGAPEACAGSNCTTPLFAALHVAGVRPGDEVITVSYSFVATANSIRHLGAVPVFVDIDPETFNMDPSKIEAAITPKTRAILCVDQIGMPCDLKAITEIG